MDALLDIRLGTLITLSNEFALEVTTKPSYFTRQVERFSTEKHGELSMELYKAVFDKEKEKIARNSPVTKIPEVIRRLQKEFIKQAIFGAQTSFIQLDVNTYPFNYTEDEKVKLINALDQCLGSCIDINLVSFTPEELTCKYVSDNYIVMIMYDYYTWMNTHKDQISKRVLLNSTGLYVPRVNFIREFTKEETELLKTIGPDADYFDLMTDALKTMISVQGLPIAHYCVDTPMNKAEYRYKLD